MRSPVPALIDKRLIRALSAATNASQVLHGLGAIRVPQIEHRGLGEDVGRTQAAWVRGIAFDFGRPAVVASDE